MWPKPPTRRPSPPRTLQEDCSFDTAVAAAACYARMVAEEARARPVAEEARALILAPTLALTLALS